jgi:hypothetical protein
VVELWALIVWAAMEELSSQTQSDAERVLDSWKIFNITEKRIALDQQVSKSKPDETRTN